MTDHVFETHTDCDKPHCNICVGGLAYCTVCGGAEGDLPTDCPGEKLAYGVLGQIYQGEIDYINGKWVKK